MKSLSTQTMLISHTGDNRKRLADELLDKYSNSKSKTSGYNTYPGRTMAVQMPSPEDQTTIKELLTTKTLQYSLTNYSYELLPPKSWIKMKKY